jgi:hypothetical protein
MKLMWNIKIQIWHEVYEYKIWCDVYEYDFKVR